MMPGTDKRRWTFTMPTVLGETRSTFEIGDDALHFESDDLLGGGSEVLRWDSIREGGTAAMRGMGGRGAPDMANWVPQNLEWLTLSRTAGGGQPFMRVLPQGAQRDLLVAELSARLQGRWIGERLPIIEARKRLNLQSDEWGTTKVLGLVLAVLATLALLLLALVFLFHPVISVPLGLMVGAWLINKGRQGLHDHQEMVDVPAAKIGNAELGLVKLTGLAVGSSLSAAAVSGRSCVWWDVWVGVWQEASESPGRWQPVASRYGGEAGLLEIEDGTGRVPVWLHGATLILDSKSWESDKDTLPAAGIALLDELGFVPNDSRRTLVIETCVEQGAPMYVVGTLDERRNLPEPGQLRGLDRLAELVRSGAWRRELVSSLPRPTRKVAAIVIGYLDMLFKVGIGRQRTGRPEDAIPPSLAPDARVVWKGIGGRPLIVSNQPDTTTLESWRKRSLRLFAIGAAVLCLTVYQLLEFVAG